MRSIVKAFRKSPFTAGAVERHTILEVAAHGSNVKKNAVHMHLNMDQDAVKGALRAGEGAIISLVDIPLQVIPIRKPYYVKLQVNAKIMNKE